jgi:chloride channel 7
MLSNSNDHTVINLLQVGYPNLLSLSAIAVFFIYYFFGSGYAVGCGIATGMFVPMMVMGASYGRLVGLILGDLYSQFTDPGIFAIVGMAAFLAGVSRLSISLTVIVIETTNDLANLLPIMLAVMAAKFVADSINHPIFDSQIAIKNIPFLEPPVKEMNVLMCKHIMASDPKYFMEKDRVGNIMTVCMRRVRIFRDFYKYNLK